MDHEHIQLVGGAVAASQIFLYGLFKLAGSDKAALVGHKFVSLGEHLFCSIYGISLWLNEAQGITDRAYGVSEGAAVICRANFVFQVYDLIMTLAVKDLRKPEMLAHHAVTGLLAYYVITGNYLHYYVIYFVGVAEFSSIPLVFVDTCKQFPSVAKSFPTLELLAKMLFALTFIALRVVYWPIISYGFWIQSIDLLQSGKAHDTTAVSVFLVANVFLTLLQQYWGTLVFKGLYKVIAGDKKKQDKKKTK